MSFFFTQIYKLLNLSYLYDTKRILTTSEILKFTYR